MITLQTLEIAAEKEAVLDGFIDFFKQFRFERTFALQMMPEIICPRVILARSPTFSFSAFFLQSAEMARNPKHERALPHFKIQIENRATFCNWPVQEGFSKSHHTWPTEWQTGFCPLLGLQKSAFALLQSVVSR